MMSIEWGQYTDRELLGHYAGLMDALRTRNVVRSSNNPIADYAEMLVANALDLRLAGRSASGFDATDATGLQYQIKARRRTPQNSSTQLSALRNLEKDPFHFLAAVMFEADFSIQYAAVIPLAVVRQLSGWSEHTKSHRFLFRRNVLEQPGVQDITGRLNAYIESKDQRAP